MRAATATAIVTDADAEALAAQSGLRLVGFSMTELADEPGAASFVLWHGDNETGTPIGWFSLSAGAVQTVVIGDRGIAVDDGVFVELLSGEVALSLWHTIG